MAEIQVPEVMNNYLLFCNYTSTRIVMKEKISVDLALRDSAREFFEFVESLPSTEVVLDFKDVRSISRSFAHEFICRKRISQKKVKEVNVPPNVRKMFAVVEIPQEKRLTFNTRMIKVVSL